MGLLGKAILRGVNIPGRLAYWIVSGRRQGHPVFDMMARWGGTMIVLRAAFGMLLGGLLAGAATAQELGPMRTRGSMPSSGRRWSGITSRRRWSGSRWTGAQQLHAWGESMTGVPATPDMHFRNGAVAIAYLGTLLLQLHDQGALALDDPLSTWFPDYPSADRVTPPMLISGTSGYADYVTDEGFLAALHADPFRPGRRTS